MVERNKDVAAEIAQRGNLSKVEKNTSEVIILAMPNVPEDHAKRFMHVLGLMSPYLPFNVAVVYDRIAALTKDDILQWQEKIDSIIKENNWS